MTFIKWRGHQLARFSLYVLSVIGGLTVIVFVISGLVMGGGFERAWEVLVGVQSPFDEAPLLGVMLSALGFLFVPTVIGVAVADGIAQYIHSHLDRLPEAEERILERAKATAKKVADERIAKQQSEPASGEAK